MREIEIFRKSFNFDNNIVSKTLYLLRHSSRHFNTLPVEIIREIVNMIAFKKKGYYYNIRDTFQWPHEVNKYLGKYIGRQNDLIKVSYNGWGDDYNESVPLKNISYLNKDAIPGYYRGGYLDIMNPYDNKWFVGLIWETQIINNEKFFTIIYKININKKLMIVTGVPIYYKYMCPMRSHTKYWPVRLPTDYKFHLNWFNRSGLEINILIIFSLTSSFSK